MNDEIKKLKEEIAECLYNLDYKDHQTLFPDDKNYPTWSGLVVIIKTAYYDRADAILHAFAEHGGCLLADDQTFSDSPSLPERIGQISSTETFAWRKGRASLTKEGFKRVVLVEGKHEDR